MSRWRRKKLSYAVAQSLSVGWAIDTNQVTWVTYRRWHPPSLAPFQGDDGKNEPIASNKRVYSIFRDCQNRRLDIETAQRGGAAGVARGPGTRIVNSHNSRCEIDSNKYED